MRVDISFLPALAAAFLLAFARVGTMVMLMPGLGKTPQAHALDVDDQGHVVGMDY